MLWAELNAQFTAFTTLWEQVNLSMRYLDAEEVERSAGESFH
jgi:hypothetical protein